MTEQTELSLAMISPGWHDLSGAVLEHLKGMTKLQTLVLAGARITDENLVHLNGLTNLRKLSLRGTLITDAGLEHVKEFTDLEDLDLDKTQITGGAIRWR